MFCPRLLRLSPTGIDTEGASPRHGKRNVVKHLPCRGSLYAESKTSLHGCVKSHSHEAPNSRKAKSSFLHQTLLCEWEYSPLRRLLSTPPPREEYLLLSIGFTPARQRDFTTFVLCHTGVKHLRRPSPSGKIFAHESRDKLV